jgi:hypothetical protein
MSDGTSDGRTAKSEIVESSDFIQFEISTVEQESTMGFEHRPVALAAFLLLSLDSSRVCAFTSTTPLNTAASHAQERSRIASKEGLMRSAVSCELFNEKRGKKECRPCEEPVDDDIDLSKREATFAMLGSIWAIGMLPTALLFPTEANAAYGASSNMPAQGIIIDKPKAGPKATVQYQGQDNQRVLDRLEKQSDALATIPDLIEDKKWSKVTGVLLGPMGELLQTMGKLADTSENAVAARDVMKQTKLDLYAITAAVGKKNVDKATELTLAVQKDIAAFLKVL